MNSHFLAAKTPVGIEFPEGKLIDITVSVSKTRLKHEIFVNAKNKISQKRKTQEKQVAAPEEVIPMKQATKLLIYPKLCTISSENKSLEEETPNELSPEVESPEEKRYLKL